MKANKQLKAKNPRFANLGFFNISSNGSIS